MHDRDDSSTIRPPQPTRLRDGVRILDIENYVPFLLNATSNAWQRRTSADYRARFGIGIVEWRVIAMLNIEPGITASRICEEIRMDKSAVSRTLAELDAKGHVTYDATGSDPRKRRWTLSPAGLDMHDAVLSAALEHEKTLMASVPPEDFITFLNVMRRMLANVDPRD